MRRFCCRALGISCRPPPGAGMPWSSPPSRSNFLFGKPITSAHCSTNWRISASSPCSQIGTPTRCGLRLRRGKTAGQNADRQRLKKVGNPLGRCSIYWHSIMGLTGSLHWRNWQALSGEPQITPEKAAFANTYWGHGGGSKARIKPLRSTSRLLLIINGNRVRMPWISWGKLGSTQSSSTLFALSSFSTGASAAGRQKRSIASSSLLFGNAGRAIAQDLVTVPNPLA